MIITAKDIVKKLLHYGGYYRLLRLVRSTDEKWLLIFMYHNLHPDERYPSDPLPLQERVTSAVFEAHLKVLTGSCRMISVEEAVAEMKDGGLKENSAAITLDDGYASAYRIAFPLLSKYGVTATIYLPTGWINGKLTPWWEVLAEMVRAARPGDVDSGGVYRVVGLPDGPPLQDDLQSRAEFYQSVSFAMMKMSDAERNQAMEDISKPLLGGRFVEPPAVKPCTWEEISDMADAGIRFGAHTVTHPNLSYVDLDTVEAEIKASITEIENRLGTKVKGFAYPYGYDLKGYPRLWPVLERLGLDYAVTSWRGFNLDDADRYLLYRHAFSPVTSAALLHRELYLITRPGKRHPPPMRPAD